MEPFDRILVATDFSDGAERALRRAATLASLHGLPLELVHVMSAAGLASVREGVGEPVDMADRLAEEARRLLESRAAPLGASHRVIVGEMPDAVCEACTEGMLVVAGANTGAALEKFLLGNNAEKIARDCPGPVLVVRREGAGPYREIVAGVDLGAGCSGLLDTVMRFAPGARITAVHAYDVPFEGALQRAGLGKVEIERHRAHAFAEAHARIEALARDAGGPEHRVLPLVERGDPASLVAGHAQALDADLVVVARRGRTHLERLLLGSVARRVLADTDRDVLVLRGPAPG